MRKPYNSDIAAVAFLAGLVSLFFADFLLGISSLYARDLFLYFYPNKAVLREIVWSGQFPWWNPYLGAGQPLSANPAFEVFYPPNWLIFLPDFAFGFKLHILFHLYLITISMYCFLRSVRCGVTASLFGSISWGLGGIGMSLTNLLPMLFSLAWMPLIFLFGIRAMREFRRRDAAATALFAGLQILVGEPTTLIQTWLLMSAYGGWRFWNSREKADRVAIVKTFVAVFIWALCIGAVQLLPAIDHLTETSRSRGLSADSLMEWSFPPARLLELSNPFLFGYLNDEGRYAWWGRMLYEVRLSPYVIRIHSGFLLLPLMIAGLLSRGSRRALFLSLVIPLLLISLGSHTPLGTLGAPAFSFVGRFPEKFIAPALFVMIAFASHILDQIIRGDRDLLRRTVITASILGVIIAACAGFSSTDHYETFFLDITSTPRSGFAERLVQLSRSGWIFSVTMAGCWVMLLLAMQRGKIASRVTRAAIVGILALELLTTSFDTVPRVDKELYSPPPAVSTLDPDRDQYRIFHFMDWLERSEHSEGYALTGHAATWVARNAMYPRLPAAWGFRTVLEGDYDLTLLVPTIDFIESMFRVQLKQERWRDFFLPVSNVRFVAMPRSRQRELERVGGRASEMQPADFIGRAHLPRFYFATELRRIAGKEDFIRQLSEAIPDPRTTFVELDPRPITVGIIDSIDEQNSSIEIAVRAEREAFLVLSVTPHKYWSATVDGNAEEIHVTNVGYQGIFIPAGEHRVLFRYFNPLIALGAAFSIPGSVAALLLLIGSRRTPQPASAR